MKSVRQIYAELDKAWDRETQEYEERIGSAFPCGPGCADCCKARVENVPMPVGQREADVLWEEMSSLPAPTREEILERLLIGDPHVCVFLSSDDLCLVYDSRPPFCRIFGLSGLVTCGRISGDRRGALWVMTVNLAHAALRAGGDSLVSVRRLIERMGR